MRVAELIMITFTLKKRITSTPPTYNEDGTCLDLSVKSSGTQQSLSLQNSGNSSTTGNDKRAATPTLPRKSVIHAPALPSTNSSKVSVSLVDEHLASNRTVRSL